MGKEYAKKIETIDEDSRRLNPFILDNFEKTAIAPWTSSGTGTPTAEISTEKPYREAKSIKLQTRATTPAINDNVGISQSPSRYPGKFAKIGFVVFHGTPVTNLRIDTHITIHDDDLGSDYTLRYLSASSQWQIKKSDNTYQTIEEEMPLVNGYIFIELTIDTIVRKYNKLILANKEYDLSAYPAYEEGGMGNPGVISVGITITTLVAAQSSPIYIDDFIYIGE